MPALLANITTLDVDAVVTAANEALAAGGGADGAVHRGAGPELPAACRRPGGCPTGEACTAPGFRLRALHVIHTVGPVRRGGGHGGPALLAGAYRAAPALLRGAGGASIAFPAISTGICGYPRAGATRIAVSTCLDAGGGLDTAFACINAAALAAHEKEPAAP
jgi:O-acetyl-ADP-ribose deacetylase (regulator of RNase III)